MALTGLLLPDLSALADGSGQNDAGSGGDAGDTRAVATSILLGTYAGKLTPQDEDWYVSNLAGTGLTCVEASATGDGMGWLTTGAETATGRKAATRFAPGVTARAGVAVDSASRAVVGITPPSGSVTNYQFQLSLVGVPDPSLGDAFSGTDAASSLSEAFAPSGACFGGRLHMMSGFTDSADAYRVTAAAGDVVTYSLAASRAGVSVRLVDASGTTLGTPAASGQSTQSPVLEGGTYFLVVSSSSGLDSATYMVGTAVGPPEPNGCRPYC